MEGGVRVCGDAVLQHFLIYKLGNKTKRFAIFRNFRVISMRLAVFLRYSMRCLQGIRCGFAVFVPPYAPLVIALVFSNKSVINKEKTIHYFHIVHNAPCLPPKLCITIVLDFSWDDCNTQEKLETMVMENSGETSCIMV